MPWVCAIFGLYIRRDAHCKYRKSPSLRRTKLQNFDVSTCSCLRLIHWSQVLSQEWRCSWMSVLLQLHLSDQQMYCLINWGAFYIRGLTLYRIVVIAKLQNPIRCPKWYVSLIILYNCDSHADLKSFTRKYLSQWRWLREPFSQAVVAYKKVWGKKYSVDNDSIVDSFKRQQIRIHDNICQFNCICTSRYAYSTSIFFRKSQLELTTPHLRLFNI